MDFFFRGEAGSQPAEWREASAGAEGLFGGVLGGADAGAGQVGCEEVCFYRPEKRL